MGITPVIQFDGGRMSTKMRGMSKSLKEAMKQALVLRYFKEFLPGHFTKGAYRKYPDVYKKRYTSKRVEWADQKGEQRRAVRKRLREPMVWTGTLKRNVLTSVSVRGSSKRMRAFLRGSQVANFHRGDNRHAGGYDMVAELRAVSDREIELMAADIERDMVQWLGERGKRETVRTR